MVRWRWCRFIGKSVAAVAGMARAVLRQGDTTIALGVRGGRGACGCSQWWRWGNHGDERVWSGPEFEKMKQGCMVAFTRVLCLT
jgi:hypothetical protein